MPGTYVVGVDLGGSHVSAAVVDIAGESIGFAEADIDRTRPPDTILRQDVAEVISGAIVKSDVPKSEVKAVGMGLPGNIDRDNGICRFSPNFHWRDVRVALPLHEALGYPVFLLNDVRSHTLGELHFGGGRGLKSFAMMAIGTGIGGGVVLDGTLIEGSHSAGGELGHITVDPNGPHCECGNNGCVESLASGPAIVRAAQLLVAEGHGAAILALAGKAHDITPAHVFQAAEAGDKEALDLWDAAGRWIGIAVAAVMTTVDVDCFLIGGGVGKAGDLLIRPIFREVNRRFRMVPPNTARIEQAQLGDRAGVIGAAALALESIGALKPALQKRETSGV